MTQDAEKLLVGTKGLREFWPLDDVGPTTRTQRQRIQTVCNQADALALNNIAKDKEIAALREALANLLKKHCAKVRSFDCKIVRAAECALKREVPGV